MSVETRVLLAGKCPFKNQGIHSNLSTIDNSIIIETTTELEQLPELCSFHQPNLLLIVLDGLEDRFNAISHRLSAVNILGLSIENGQVCQTLIRKSIINGCLPETAPPETLIQAMRAVASGYTWFSQSLLYTILRPISQSKKNQHILADRERSVLRLVMQEKTNKHIGQEIGIGERTVCDHLSVIYEKLGVVSRVGAALKAERMGLIEE